MCVRYGEDDGNLQVRVFRSAVFVVLLLVVVDPPVPTYSGEPVKPEYQPLDEEVRYLYPGLGREGDCVDERRKVSCE